MGHIKVAREEKAKCVLYIYTARDVESGYKLGVRLAIPLAMILLILMKFSRAQDLYFPLLRSLFIISLINFLSLSPSAPPSLSDNNRYGLSG